MKPSTAPLSSIKSPLLAVLISIPLPGLGHFYIGSFMRGGVIMIGYYILLPALTSLHVPHSVIGWAVAVGFIARDAWFCAKAAAVKETAELSAGVQPRRWLVWTWVACRIAWIVVLPALIGLAILIPTVVNATQAPLLSTLTTGVGAAIPLIIAGLAGHETWTVATGIQPVTESALQSEIGTTAIISGICVLLLAIVAPTFSNLFRYSAEGAIKGNLGALRQAVDRYRNDHDGRSPDSIGAMVEAKTLPEMPVLWRKFDEIPHTRTAEAAIVASSAAMDSGRWAFIVSPSSPGLTGTIFIDCTHTDAHGRIWGQY